MTARILVVDDLLPNIKLLEVRLTAEYFDVVTATNGPDALALCEGGACDIVLLDVMMPGMDGFEVCRRLKATPNTAHLPVVMVTALDQPADRLMGLDAGADDFLTKPVNEVALLARVKSLVRLKMVMDELRGRALASPAGQAEEAALALVKDSGDGGRVLIVEDRASAQDRLLAALRGKHQVAIEPDPQRALIRVAEEGVDLVLVSLGLQGFDGLRLCGQLRSLERTRKVPILLLADLDDEPRVVRGLDMGLNDYLMRPVDRNELLARVRTQVRRKRFMDRLDESLQQSLQAAVTDTLTGLANRRAMQSHLTQLVNAAASRRQMFSLVLLDIDHFKAVNDTYGHDAGDDVLKEFAQRLRKAVRGSDIVCRSGGEEFVVLMPDTEIDVAARVAERIRLAVAGEAFPVQGGLHRLAVTTSMGLSGYRGVVTTADAILKRADEALYRAKRGGRNRVVLDAA